MTGLLPESITRDYYLHRCVHVLADAYPPGEMVADPYNGVDVGWWAFAGGTALVSAHRVTERYSEDLDVLLTPTHPTGIKARRRVRRHMVQLLVDSLTGDTPVSYTRTGGRHITTAEINMIGRQEALKVDIVNQNHIADTLETRRSVCLLGRVATEDQLAQYPELGGFEVPVISAVVTAAGKFDALHRRAMLGHYDQVTERARDLYDLACIARSESHATQTQERLPEIALALAKTGIRRKNAFARPASGYASSPVFQVGHVACDALREGYKRMQPMIFGDYRPSFSEATEAACSLDPGR